MAENGPTIKPMYGRGPAPWVGNVPTPQHRGRKDFDAPESGSQRNFNRPWSGDGEMAMQGLSKGVGFVQRNLGNYMLYRAAVSGVEDKLGHIEQDVHSLGAPNTQQTAPTPLGLPAGARPMPGPTEPRALGPAPSAIPLGPGSPPDRPKFGLRGGPSAPDARTSTPGSLHYPNAIDVTPGRRSTGGNDRRLKGLISRQLNDRM